MKRLRRSELGRSRPVVIASPVTNDNVTRRDTHQDLARLRDTPTADLTGPFVNAPVGFWCGTRHSCATVVRYFVSLLIRRSCAEGKMMKRGL